MNRPASYKVFAFVLLGALPLALRGQQKNPTEGIESVYGLAFTQAERDSMAAALQSYQKDFEALHQFPLDNSVAMSLSFDPLPVGFQIETVQRPIDWGLPKEVALPVNPHEIAFLPVYKLAVLIKSKKLSSQQLTRIYLDRIKRYSDTLQCVITVLEEQALAQAKAADDEIAKGRYRGPLHGIPYGVKDLLTVDGTKTTWGAAPYKEQVISGTATVVKKLQEAGAVLLCKFTLGALAMGDIWYGGVTKNPWNLKQGSSGSSAGSAAGTVAGLVAFSIGTETLGSIVSPSTRCGASGLRPTFGRVSRTGAMALSWSMDKIGPICRSALDCALVLDAIRGSDLLDKHVRNASFNYSARTDIKKLKVAYLKTAFESSYGSKANDEKALAVIRSLGIEPVPVVLPTEMPVSALRIMLTAEGAAAFEALTRTNLDDELTDQRKQAWPNLFRAARFIPAVEYINASRVRQLLIEAYQQQLGEFDVIISPSFANNQLLTTNLTGHPCVVVPNGFTEQGSPTSISFLGKLFGEANVVAVARAYQEATEWDEKLPPDFLK
jgi:Asp-tRNA(Asn)/Glu-tRNA(Gln) amidotransferase A subunit family amidase